VVIFVHLPHAEMVKVGVGGFAAHPLW
jgi:hypothetical protein